jgi:hypothetical protein
LDYKCDLSAIRYWNRMFKEEDFWEEIEIRKLLNKNYSEIDNTWRKMQRTLKHAAIKKSYETIFILSGVISTDIK